METCHLQFSPTVAVLPVRPFCGGPRPAGQAPLGGFRALLPFPAPPLRQGPEACSAECEGGPPGKPEEQGPFNYGAAFLAPLRKAQAPS